MHVRNLYLAWLLIGTACVGDTGTETSRPGCTEVVSERRVAPDEQTAVGSARDWSARAEQVSTATVTYRESPEGTPKSSALALEFVLDASSAKVLTRSDGESPDALCSEVMELPATLGLHTEDGAFNEAFTMTARVDGGQLAFRGVLPIANLRGSYRPSGFPAGFTELHVQLFVDAASNEGSITLEAPGLSDQGSADVGGW